MENLEQNQPVAESSPTPAPTELKTKSSPLFIALLCFLMFVLGGGLVFAYFTFFKPEKVMPQPTVSPTPSPVSSPSPSPSPDITAGWKIYKNKEHSFQIKYPEAWNILPDSEYLNMTFISPNEIPFIKDSEPPITPVSIFVTKGIDMQKKIADLEKFRQYKDFKSESISIEGIGMRKISGVLTAESYTKGLFNIEILIPKESSIINISYLEMLRVDQNLFNQILSTFRFLD